MASFWQGTTDQHRTEIVSLLARATPIRLADAITSVGTQVNGVYALYYSGPCPDCQSGRNPVYVGSARSSVGGRLRDRLHEHYASIKGTQRLKVEDISVRYVATPQTLAGAAELLLIEHFHKPIWNASGFGSKAHGKGRPDQRVSLWDQRHPGRSHRGTGAPPAPKAPGTK